MRVERERGVGVARDMHPRVRAQPQQRDRLPAFTNTGPCISLDKGSTRAACAMYNSDVLQGYKGGAVRGGERTTYMHLPQTSCFGPVRRPNKQAYERTDDLTEALPYCFFTIAQVGHLDPIWIPIDTLSAHKRIKLWKTCQSNESIFDQIYSK